jgi:hypothetical protein
MNDFVRSQDRRIARTFRRLEAIAKAFHQTELRGCIGIDIDEIAAVNDKGA